MTVFDGVSLSLILFSMVWGAWRGLVWEAVSLLGWFGAFFVAHKGTPVLTRWLAWQGLWHVMAFVILFLLGLLLFGLLSTLLKKGVKAMGLRPIDRSLGAIFGWFRGVLWVLLLAWLVLVTPLHQKEFWQQAYLKPYCIDTLGHLKTWFPDYLLKVLP
jgi:membrane protein required for colicin V production